MGLIFPHAAMASHGKRAEDIQREWLQNLHITHALALVHCEPIEKAVAEAPRSGWKDPAQYNLSRGENEAAMQMLYACVLNDLPEITMENMQFARDAVHRESVTQEQLKIWYESVDAMQRWLAPIVREYYDPSKVDHTKREYGNPAVYWFRELLQYEEWRERYASINGRCRVWIEDPGQPWNAAG